MASVRVAVRVRPLNKREKQLSSKVIIHVNGSTTSIYKAPHIRGDELKDFSFDFSYDSTDRGSPVFASQERIFLDLGSDILKATFAGFNACMFAYGQTGSGKSYTMMGHAEDKGLIPRICEGLFCEISHRSKSDAVSFRTEVSYLEIYNERVRDLLHKRTTPTDGGGLKVREHPRDGPYVENLSKHFIHNHSEMEDLIVRGNANRTTASTAMNDVSSRSHAILTINFTQAWFDEELPRETLSKIHLVDLAGSERADATCVTGIRLKEGANINKSLVTLGSVISALADLRVGASTKKKKHIFIPYRDSVLTWLLKDSLGGNSMTTMIATVSPADVNLSETLSTLRYASRAKNIVNSPTVNEDGSVKVIRELRAEVTRLQKLLEEANQVFHGELSLSEKVEEELHQNEAKVLALTKEWSSKWNETQNILQEETVALRKEGSGVILDCQLPHLIDIEDVLSTGIILYYLKEGRTLIGSDKTSRSQDIVLRGPGLLSEHCVLENRAGTVTLIPQDGALCSVNGSVVTNPCQLMQGAIIQLGNGSMLRFNHPTEAAQLREKRQGGLLSAFSLSLTDMPKSTENLSKAMLQNPRRMEEKLNQQEVAWQQVQGSLNRCNRDIKGLPKENSGTPHQWSAEEQRKRAEMEETGNGEMDIMGAEMVPSSCLTSAIPEKLMMRAITGKYPVPQTNFELDGDILQRGVSTRDGHDQERDSCHKSRPGLMSERPWRKAQSGVGVASYKGEEVWSGDASLQQTSVLGPGDGCGMKPEGNANEIQGVVADCYKGRPDSGGSSLRSMSHLQSSGGTSSTSVLPQTSTHSQLDKKPLNSQAPCRPPEETVCKGKFCCGEMDESGLKEIPVCVTETTAATAQSSGLSSLISRVSWMVQDAGHLLWSSRTVLQRVKKRGLQPLGAYWSSHVVSLVRDSNVVSAVKDSQVFSMVKGSFVFSLLKDSHIFSTVKELPLIQHIQMEITQHLQPTVTAQVIQDCINLETAQLPGLTPTQTFSKTEDWPVDTPPIPEDSWTRNKSVGDLPQEKDLADLKQGDKLITELLSLKQISELEVAGISEDKDLTLETSKTVQGVQIFTQTLIEFPDSLSKLQTLPFLDMMDTLHAIISTSVNNSQKISVLCWLNVAKCSQPEPCPALLILADTGFYTLTTDTGPLVLFHHLPFLQLKEVHIGLAGHSLRLMGTTEESILGVYTHSQKLTRDLCWAIFSVICPGDSRVSQHPLIFEDLMKISLDWQAYVPDLLLDAGFRVCCQFQKRLADLVYLLHCNMDKKTVSLGEVKLLLYASVKVCISPGNRTEPLSQLVLTDTHLGLVQVDSVFHPTPSSITIGPCRPLFHDLTLRQRSDVRCVLVHDEDKCGAVRLDVILSNVRSRGHPESMSEAAALPAHASNSPLHAEVWKLTFSCSTEAACLINHLSNV